MYLDGDIMEEKKNIKSGYFKTAKILQIPGRTFRRRS